MVKGVNKKIIEINHPDSIYFDRAVFYLKPEITEFPQQLSQADAEAILMTASPCQGRRHRWIWTVFLILMSCIGTALICKFLF